MGVTDLDWRLMQVPPSLVQLPPTLWDPAVPTSRHSPAHLPGQKPRLPQWGCGSFYKNDPCLLVSLANEVKA